MARRPFESLGGGAQFRRLRRLGLNALAAYDLGVPDDDIRVVPLAHLENTTFRIDVAATRGVAPRRYVLRIHRPNAKPATRIRSEMTWLSALRRDTALVVPGPVATRDGDYCVAADAPGVPGPRQCVLLEWVHGRFCGSQRLTRRHLYRMGVLAARLHEHASHFHPPPDFDRPIMDRRALTHQILDDLGRIPAFTRENQSLFAAVVERVGAALDTLGQSPETFGLIHADLHPGNVLFAAGEARPIDFDDCAHGYWLADVAVTQPWLESRPDYPFLHDAMLDGYRSIRPLPAHHAAHLPAFIAARQLTMLEWMGSNVDTPSFRPWVHDAIAETLRSLTRSVPCRP